MDAMLRKATAIGVLVVAIATTERARAASTTDDVPPAVRPNAVQLDLGLAVIGLAYERIFHPRFAVQLEAQIFGTWFGPIVDLPNMRGFGGQIRPSFFITDDAP